MNSITRAAIKYRHKGLIHQYNRLEGFIGLGRTFKISAAVVPASGRMRIKQKRIGIRTACRCKRHAQLQRQPSSAVVLLSRHTGNP